MKEQELKVGDRIRDNDPRMTGRVLLVTSITQTGVVAGRVVYGCPTFPYAHIRRDRIHTDGKPRRSGFSLVVVESVAHHPV